MATPESTIHLFPPQVNALPKPDTQGATRKVTANIVEGLLAKSLAKDNLFGRLCGSVVIAKIRREGQR